MSRYRHYDDPGYSEREPLDNYHSPSRSPGPVPSSPYHDQQPYQQQYQQQRQQPYEQHPPEGFQYEHGDSSRAAGAHPDSAFARLRAERQQGRHGGRENYADLRAGGMAATAGAGAGGAAGYAAQQQQQEFGGPPQPPPHGSGGNGNHNNWGVTPGADNFGEVASGGMAGIAYTIADQNARQSGVEAMRDIGHSPAQPQGHYAPPPSMPQQAYDNHHPSPPAGYYAQGPRPSLAGIDQESHSSLTPLGAAAVAPGMGTPSRSPLGYNGAGHPSDPYHDDPYQGYSTSRNNGAHLGVVNPNDIADDGDDGLGYRRPQRTSMLSLSHSDRGSSTNGTSVAVGAVAAGGVAGAMGGVAGAGAGGGGGKYGPVEATSAFDVGPEKSSDWVQNQNKGRKKWKWCAIIGVIFIIVAAIVGGTVGGILSQRGSSGSGNGGSGSGKSAEEDADENGDLSIKSQEIKDLMDNKDLHRVFWGIDYTPIHVQYPYCLHDPPSQNNVTRDVAVLSQLTNQIRLYGNDCNQTEMVLHALERLELDDTKVILGVWLDKNETTNARQLSQFWNILDEHGEDPFTGVIVGNEVLFRDDLTIDELSTVLKDVRSNMTSKGYSLPVSTSDLGDDWDSNLAAASDAIMSNIHPFFAYQPADTAAAWTWNFWETANKQFWKSDNDMNVIAEIGWPTSGGTNCADLTTTCTSNGAKASVEGLNQLLEDWICPAMRNETRFLWFSAFDEPWKAAFDEPGKAWESKWGLMDVNRNLKDGVTIPDCGGQEV